MASLMARRDRDPISMLADIEGEPTVVQVVPLGEDQEQEIKGHDKAVFAAVTREEDRGLRAYQGRRVVDAKTGQGYRFYVDGDGIRGATDSGEFELSDLWYGGGRRQDVADLDEEDE